MRWIRDLWRRIDAHFEAVFHVYLWVNASVLAAIVGRPWLAAIGVITVAPFILGWALRAHEEK